MKPFEEIEKSQRIRILQKGKDGMSGEISLPLWRGTFIASTGAGWEHVSVAPYKHRITPSWDDMCTIKDLFFEDEEAAIQIHPKKSEYVNNLQNCLHLWRCTYKEMVLPPDVLVGVKDGMTPHEAQKALKEAYTMAGEEYRS